MALHNHIKGKIEFQQHHNGEQVHYFTKTTARQTGYIKNEDR